ncbi:MAG: fumarylacetoacetate hydrolase family protein [Gammaproteobacteria bacterium]|jgi:2-keto-4-pentenoate hydratase|uniref:2-keto-4-pentenoate hydratase n=1 Tax=Marinovum algicola TaxID=42444 RepID=UPI0032EF1984
MPNPATSTTDLVAVAETLRRAQADRTPCAPVRDRIADADIDAAYAIQQMNIDARIADGQRLIGRKIGLTSPAVQAQLGVDQPDYGALLSDMVLPENGRLHLDDILQPKAEAEIAFILGDGLDMKMPTVVDVLRATQFIAPAIEIVGSRIANWDIRLCDTVADNASSGMFVLGSPVRKPEGFDFTGCGMRMYADDNLVSEGSGRACLGNPLNAVAWLAARMQAMGAPLRGGEVILSGALGPMSPLSTPCHIRAEIEGLGTVAFEFGE